MRQYQIQLDLVYQAITAMPEYRALSFEELRLQDYQQGSQVRRVCADCGRSLARERFSKTQWTRKRVGESRCTDCILAGAIASLRFD